MYICTVTFHADPIKKPQNLFYRLYRPYGATPSSHWTFQPWGDTYESLAQAARR